MDIPSGDNISFREQTNGMGPDCEPMSVYSELQHRIKELEQTRADLFAANHQLQAVLDAASEISIAATDCDGLITVFNHGAEKMLGYRADEVVGKQTLLAFHLMSEIEGRSRLLSKELGHPAAGFSVFIECARLFGAESREWTYVRKDGSMLLVNLIVTAVNDEHGAVSGYLGVAVDITDHKRVEAEHLAQQQAEAANKAKSIFLANMSHELRTPLNAILGFSQLMLREPSITSRQMEFLTTINRSGDHLLSLINNVLEISRIEAQQISVELSNFCPRITLKNIYSMFQLKASAKKLKFTLAGLDELPPYVETDEGKLRQILVNIVDNAIKFTAQGEVCLRASVKSEGMVDARLLIEVEDTGPGINKSDIERVFQPFEQVTTCKHINGGSGLGIAISSNYARMLGGDISLTSILGKGSTFLIDIAVRKGKEPKLKKALYRTEVRCLAPGQAIPRILVAEDMPDSSTLLVQLLTMTGFEVRAVGNGKEALDIAAEWHPHFIWMDVRMPVMDGMEATRLIKGSEWGKSIIIAALTASGMVEDRESIMTAGFDDFISKPFREYEIFDVMSRALGLKYLYGNVAHDEQLLVDGEEITPHHLKNEVPRELLDELRRAVLALDIAQTKVVTNKITVSVPAIGNALKGLAENLEYEKLLNLLEKTE